MSRPFRVCLVASEVTPFAKTGGLGDVAAALPRALGRKGHDVRIFLPFYADLEPEGQAIVPVEFIQNVPISIGFRELSFSLHSLSLPRSHVTVYLVRCPELYGGPGLYAGDRQDALRFAYLTRAAIESCQRMGFGPDVFHGNDWHAALLPIYLNTLYSWDRLFWPSRTMLTLHNLAYQGLFPRDVLPEIGLEDYASLFFQDDLKAGRMSFLKSGILYSDVVTTVSRTYAREIQTEEMGWGLDGLLRARRDRLVGIVNGVDYEDWNPSDDHHIPSSFGSDDLSGKAECKRQLLAQVGLHPTDGPVLGIVSRLTTQKGFDLCFDALPKALSQSDLRLVVLGSGESRYEGFFRMLQDAFPGRCHFHNGYSNELAHRIYAGSDLFLMPSRFEPCGLSQMYAMRYGSAPVVRKTGGLADTVRHFDHPESGGTGFVFEHLDSQGLSWALGQGLDLYRNHTDAWTRLRRNGMQADFSWDRQADSYLQIFSQLRGR